MYYMFAIQSPIDTLVELAESFLEFFREYGRWIGLGLAAIVVGIVLYKLFTSTMQKPRKYGKKTIKIIQEISQLNEIKISDFKFMNDSEAVENFLKEARWTIKNWENYLKRKLDPDSVVRLQTNIRELPKTYEAVKKGGLFPEKGSGKKNYKESFTFREEKR